MGSSGTTTAFSSSLLGTGPLQSSAGLLVVQEDSKLSKHIDRVLNSEVCLDQVTKDRIGF